jgi:hypothetical protein
MDIFKKLFQNPKLRKDVSGRTYFSINGSSIDKVGREGKERGIFLVPHTGNGSKNSK